MNALKWIPILPFAVIAIHMQPLRAQEGKPENSKYAPEKKVDLMNLTIPEYIDFCKSMIKSSEEDKDAFAKSSKTMLIGMMGLENRKAQQRILDIDPMFNRSLLFCLVASQNKIKLDKEDMENFKNDCAKTGLKTNDESERLFIAQIYGLILSINEKLPERAAP